MARIDEGCDAVERVSEIQEVFMMIESTLASQSELISLLERKVAPVSKQTPEPDVKNGVNPRMTDVGRSLEEMNDKALRNNARIEEMVRNIEL